MARLERGGGGEIIATDYSSATLHTLKVKFEKETKNKLIRLGSPHWRGLKVVGF